ncbi:uncharacterized protein ASCRUDRAFT_75482 [Ascoidea rubescens DSM 1968]|uniref:Bul1 N-terminal domain-containing protein n=1 Tax=Ascoidea rubescens DSM 1968 TaxID=1344418 RepID=A0A1D2VIJ7_9ASCO|nr:hypothetical protein ASCRUDRAFT_75482 [Ascoidea rubescens DSM 1968]ODV61472.1 hypothetical protein ASCRUDRAFT_75482 [Ascoidea rubescens DSM 1968]
MHQTFINSPINKSPHNYSQNSNTSATPNEDDSNNMNTNAITNTNTNDSDNNNNIDNSPHLIPLPDYYSINNDNLHQDNNYLNINYNPQARRISNASSINTNTSSTTNNYTSSTTNNSYNSYISNNSLNSINSTNSTNSRNSNFSNISNNSDTSVESNTPVDLLDTSINFDKILSLKKSNNAFVKLSIILLSHPDKIIELNNDAIVYGYALIENISKKPVNFDNFYISLEGHIVIQKSTNKLMTKNFLKMVDLSASWSYGYIKPSLNKLSYNFGHYQTNVKNPLTNKLETHYLGLPSNRILLPHIKYKKNFIFKIPSSNVLDNSCRHNILSHLSLPPSFGVNNHQVPNFSDLTPNILTGIDYVNNLNGSTILTKDYNHNTCVYYSVNAKLIQSPNNTSNDYYTPPDLRVTKNSQYYLRFIPIVQKNSLNNSINCLNSDFKNATSTDQLDTFYNSLLESKENIIKIFKYKEEQEEQNKNITDDNKNFSIKEEALMAQKELEFCQLKYMDFFNNSQQNPSHPNLDTSNYTTTSEVEVHTSNKLFQRKSLKLSNDQIKSIHATIDLPNYYFPYIHPKIFHKAKQSKYDISDPNQLKIFDFKINFPKDLKSLPKVEKITLDFTSITVSSIKSIPIKLSPSIFMNSYLLNFSRNLKKFDDDFKELDDSITKKFPIDIIHAMEALQAIKIEQDKFQILNVEQFSSFQSQNQNQINCSIKWDFKKNIPNTKTIVPSFQTCLLSRLYYVSANVIFDNKMVIKVPIPVTVSAY